MWHNIFVVYRKELVDTIRDRRTIFSMVIVPILVFPLLTFGFSAIIAKAISSTKQEYQKVSLTTESGLPVETEIPRLYELIKASGKVEIVSADSIQNAIFKKEIAAAMVASDNFASKILHHDSAKIEIMFDASEIKSEFAKDKLENIASEYLREILESRLKSKGLETLFIKPFDLTAKNIAPKEKMGSFMLSMFLPYMILILALTGAMYTAMDLTAGEKERGTLETILTSPIPRYQLATGKFLTILTTSIVSTLLSIASMTITMIYALTVGGTLGGEKAITITPQAIFIIAMLMIPTSSAFSAILMSISLSAKSFKEAQSYVTPFMMIMILPAMATFIPGIELNLFYSFVPFVNIALSIKQAIIGNINWLYISIVYFSCVIYAIFAIFIAHRLFEKESVLFNS